MPSCGKGITSRHTNGAIRSNTPAMSRLGIVAISARFLLIAERQAAEEDQPRRHVVLPQSPGRALAAGLLDDGEQVALDLDVAEEGLELLERRAPRSPSGQA